MILGKFKNITHPIRKTKTIYIDHNVMVKSINIDLKWMHGLAEEVRLTYIS